MKKRGGTVKKVLIAIVVIVILGAAFSRGGHGTTPSTTGTATTGEGQTTSQDVEKLEVEPTPEPEPAPEPEPEPEPAPESEVELDETYIRPEFAQSMQDYEAFMRSYVDLMLLSQQDPTNMEVLLKMADLLNQEAEMTRSFEQWESEDLTAAELALYTETQAHVMQMLAEVM